MAIPQHGGDFHKDESIDNRQIAPGVEQSKISGLTSALSGKADSTVTDALDTRLDQAEDDIESLESAVDGKQATLTGVGDVPGLTSALSSKADTSALSSYQASSEKGAANGYASLDGTGKVPSAQLPTSSAMEWGAISGDMEDQEDLQDALDGKSDTSHTHALASLSDVTITSPANGHVVAYDSETSRFVNVTPGGGSGGWYEPPIPQSDVSGLVSALSGKAPSSHTHASGDIVSGKLAELLTLFGSLEPGQTISVDEEGDLVAITPSIGGGEGLIIDDETDFGTGADGPVTATTETLTADVHATIYTVPNGVTVTIGWNTAESRPAAIFATEKIAIQAGGIVTANGSNGGNAASGVGGAGGASLSGGGGGGAGGWNTGGAAGSSPIHPGAAGGVVSTGGVAGAGGAGGTHSFSAGGAGGYSTATSATNFRGAGGGIGLRFWRLPSSIAELLGWLSGGGGGGGGASVNSVNAPGGGGGGGGGIGLYAPEIEIAGTISANGGNGGLPLSATTSGSGGGGGGGQIQLVCRALSIGSWASLSVQGGSSPQQSSTSPHTGERGQDGAVLVAAEEMPSFAGLDRAQILFLPVAPVVA